MNSISRNWTWEVASLQTRSTDFQQHAMVLTPNHISLQDVALLNTSEIVPCNQ